jgi:hypothetical protein
MTLGQRQRQRQRQGQGQGTNYARGSLKKMMKFLAILMALEIF